MPRRSPELDDYIIEELCQDPDCKRSGPWHPFDVASVLREGAENDCGLGVEFTLTLRVRRKTKRR